MVDEARLDVVGSGLVPKTAGWFVVNVRDTVWETHERFGASCFFDSREAPFADLGIGITTLLPGQPNGLYHGEDTQEDFLVLAGECLVLIEGEERHLKAWDFVHCPPHTEHIFVGSGDGPCVILMTGNRLEGRPILYPVSELALRHRAGVETETPNPGEAYAGSGDEVLERPPYWDELPWARPGEGD